MKRPDGSKSPTRKQLAKLAINYSKQMMQDKELDRPRSHKSRDLKRTQPNQGSQKSSVVATKASGVKDEVYVDQEHRDLKLHKLTHLMEVEVAKGEADGELDFKPENIEKAYTGYPQFMQRRNSQMLGTPERDRAASVDSQGRPVKPLIEDLKEALSKAKEVDSVETSQLNESSEVTSFKHDSIAPRGASTTSPPSKMTLEEKLYYLEIKHIPEYTESPMKERFDFHQRKSKEIRRVQYATYLDKTKNKPVLPKKSTLRDLFTEAPRMVPRREGSKEIIKKEEKMEVFFSNLPKMITDNSHIEQIKRGLPSRQPANEEAGLTHSFLRILEPNQEARRPNFGRSYTAVPGSQNQRRTRQERARDGLPDAPAARIVASDFDPSNHSEGYRSIHSVADNQSEDGGSFVHRPLNRDDKHRHSVPNTSRGPQEGGRQRPSQPGVSNLPLGPNKASNLTDSEVIRSDANPNRLQRSEDSLGKWAESEQDPAAYLQGSKASLDRVVNPLNQVPVSFTAGDGDNLADHLVPPIMLDFDVGEPCEVDDTDRSMVHGDTLYGDDDEPNESLLLEPGLADAPDSEDRDHSKVHSHDSEPEEDPELKANRADERDSHSQSYRSVPDNRSEEPEPVSDGPSLKSNKADDPDSLSHSYRSVDDRSEEPEPASEEEVLPPVPCPSSKIISKKEDFAFIHKVYARPRKIPEPEFAFKSIEAFRKTIDRQRSVIARNLVRTEPSPERYTKKVESTYVKRTYERPLIEPSPSRVEKSLEKTYIHNVKVPIRAEPSPERYLKKEEQTYVKRVYERPRIEPSPTRNEKKVEQTYIEAIRRQVRPDPSPERFTKKEEMAYIHKVHARKVVEPLDQKIEKSIERAYRERVREIVRPEPSPERYTKKEDSAYIKRVYQRHVVPAYEQRTEKSIERAYRERVKELVRPEPSPDRYTKKEDALYVKRVYERHAVQALDQRTEQSIERAYAKRVRELVRAEPSPERYAKQEDQAYIKKVYSRHAAPPLNQRFERSIERAYARKVYDLPRAEPSPERYHKREESLYVTKVYKRIKNPPAPAFMYQKLEAWSVQRVYIRKRILPYIAVGKFEAYRIVRTVLWQPDAETNSQDGGHDVGNIDAASDYSEVKSAAHSSKGSHIVHDSDVGEDDHPSEGEEEQQIVYVYPAGEETESTRADKEADRMKQDSDDDHLSESSYDRYTRTAPYQKFPVWVLTPSENIPALISSPDGFIVDKETGKLEIRAGDNVILEPAPLPDSLTASKVHTTFEPISDKIRKPDPERDMKECDFIVKNPENSERVPVAVELRQRELEIKNTNCTLYDPHQKELGRAALTLVEATKPVEPEQEEKDQVYVPKLIHNAFLLDDKDKVLDVLIKEEVLGGSVFLPHSVVEGVINPVDPHNSKTFFRNDSSTLEKPNQKPSRLVESMIVDPKNPNSSHRTKGISRSSIDPRSIKPEPGTVVETDYQITLKRSPNNCTEERVVREEIAIISNVPVRILTLDPNRSVIRNSQAKLDTLGVEPASETREAGKVVKRTQPELVFIPLDPTFKVLKSKILDEEPASAVCNNGEEYRGSILVEKVTDPKTGDKNLEVFILVDPDLRKSQLGAEDKPKYVQVDLDDTTKKDLKEYADLKEGIHDLVKPTAPKPKEPVVPKRNLGLDQLDLRLVDAKGRELRVNILEKGNAPEDPDDSIVENYENVYNSEDLYYQLEYGGRQIEPSQVQKPSPRPEHSQAKKGMLFSNLKPNKAGGEVGKEQPHSASKSLKDSRISSSRAAGYTPSGSKAQGVGGQDRQTPTTKLQESRPPRTDGDTRGSKSGESGRARSKSPRSYSDQVAQLRTSAARSIALYWRYSNLKPIFRKIFGQKYEPVLKKFVRQQRRSAFRHFLLGLFAGRGHPSIADIAKAADEYLSRPLRLQP